MILEPDDPSGDDPSGESPRERAERAKREAAAKSDPRRLRELSDRLGLLAEDHGIRSVVVGVAGRDVDPHIPEFMDFVESALRVEDAIFRMTRERSVLFLADVDAAGAEAIVSRLLESFAEHVALPKAPVVELGFSEIPPSRPAPALREVLLEAFPARR